MFIFIVACLGCMLCFILFILSGLFKHSLLPIKTSKELPKVSVVIAARNEEMVLPSLIKDLVNQEYPLDKLEVIIVNDRSTDATKETHPEIRKIWKTIVLATNYGQGARGMAKALKKFNKTYSEVAGLLMKYKEIYKTYFDWDEHLCHKLFEKNNMQIQSQF